jgi:hypothetical protein
MAKYKTKLSETRKLIEPSLSMAPNIRFLPSIVAEKNVTKNVHICSMCIKTNQVGKQEVGI